MANAPLTLHFEQSFSEVDLSRDLLSLEPASLWQAFALLCATPRPSCHEDLLKTRIRQLLQHKPVEIEEDAAGNLILRKAASEGCDEAPGVILQSHLDMVTQQNEGTGHDFFKDPIEPQVTNGWVKAKGTTLGADNGIGVAAILAVLLSDSIQHGPLEALLTINEETGMSGAKGLEPGVLQGAWLLNLDTEEIGELYVGCAGGVDVTACLPYSAEAPDRQLEYFHCRVRGLRGGHSGIDIHKGRGNAIKLLTRLLLSLRRQLPGLRIAELEGGSMRNALPREASALLSCEPGQVELLKRAVTDIGHIFFAELEDEEPELRISLIPTGARDLWPEALVTPLLRALSACPHGALQMSRTFPGVCETSNNLGVVSYDSSHVRIACLPRSLVDSLRDATAETVAALFELAGASVTMEGAYPGWTPNQESSLLSHMKQVHTEVMGTEPAIQVIHAGLECGILGKPYPDWEMVSFGPTIQNAHSPDERVDIASVEKFWNLLVAALEHLSRQHAPV